MQTDARKRRAHGQGVPGVFLRLGLFQKTMLLNSGVVLIGAIVGTEVTRRLAGRHSVLLLALAFWTCGVLITFAVNYLAFWGHFRPLLELRHALEAIRTGQESRRSEGQRTASMADLVDSARVLLDRAEDDSLHFSARLLGSIEAERRRIGSELHDNISQLLAAALLQIDLSERRLAAEPAAARESLALARELAGRALERIQAAVYDLRPAVLENLGLAAALRWYAKARADRPGLEVVTRLDTDERLPQDVETALYRVGQEAIANVLKHAAASRLEIGLEIRDGRAALTVLDDGKGFDPAHARGRGVGLPSMRERIDGLAGQLDIVSVSGSGTRVYATVPLPETSVREAS